MKNLRQNRIIFVFFLPYVVVLSISFLTYLFYEHSHYIQRLTSNEKIQIDLAKTSLIRDFELVLPDISVLAGEKHIQQFIHTSEDAARRLAIEEIRTFLSHKRLYRMARILDLNGMEQIRVEYKDNEVITTPNHQLQNKSHRYYFRESINFGLGELYISPIDLNIEHGEIEQPHSPMIRFAMSLYDNNLQKKGLLVLNYLADPMLRHFDEMLSGSAGHVALLNHEGYWIRSHVKSREWSFLFDQDHNFAHRHPQVWTTVSNSNEGTLRTDDGLFTYSTIYPIELIGGYSEHEVEDEHIGHHHMNPKLYSWKIISDVPSQVLTQKTYDLIFGGFGILWLLLLLIGFFLSRHFSFEFTHRKQLQLQNELHARIFNTTTDGIFITDPDTHIISCNQAFTNITGYSEQDAIGHTPRLLSSNIHTTEFYRNLWDTLMQQGYWVGEITNKHKEGYLFNELLRISAIYDDEGHISNYIAIISDITKIKERELRLQELASRDALTGLYNRHAFESMLDQCIENARESGTKIALLFIDLNKFKPINDQYGHNAGDAVLVAVAKRMMNKVRGMDIVARIGGDEFIIALKNIEARENAEKIKHSLLAAIQEPIHHYQDQLKVSASIGIALFPDDGDNTSRLIKLSDQSMYREKRALTS